MLRRLGNKSKLLPKLLPLFPENITTFIDMFMGSGAVTFAMVDRAKYVIANDNDEEVFNLFMVLKEHKEKLVEALKMMPFHEKLMQYWNEQQEHDNVWKASRFLMLSNFGYLGQKMTLRYEVGSAKGYLLNEIQNGFNALNNLQFMCCDFREVVKKLHWRNQQEQDAAFIYADPPYLGTTHNYKSGFTEDDTRELFSILISSGLRFAVSEFANPTVKAIAKENGLYTHDLGERRNLKNREREILITNYQPERQQGSLFPSSGVAASPANNGLQTTFGDAVKI